MIRRVPWLLLLAAGCGPRGFEFVGARITPPVMTAEAGGALTGTFDLQLQLDPAASGPTRVGFHSLQVLADDDTGLASGVTEKSDVPLPAQVAPGSQQTVHVTFAATGADLTTICTSGAHLQIALEDSLRREYIDGYTHAVSIESAATGPGCPP